MSHHKYLSVLQKVWKEYGKILFANSPQTLVSPPSIPPDFPHFRFRWTTFGRQNRPRLARKSSPRLRPLPCEGLQPANPRAVLPRFPCNNNIHRRPSKSVTDHRGARRGQKSAKEFGRQSPTATLNRSPFGSQNSSCSFFPRESCRR
jgi:hypothetical protein